MCLNCVRAASLQFLYGHMSWSYCLCCDTSLLLLNFFTRHCCVLFLVTRRLWCCCFHFHAFVSVMWCVRHPCFSWSSLFLAISLILPPLSPPNGALCCGTSHFLCIVTARHGSIRGGSSSLDVRPKIQRSKVEILTVTPLWHHFICDFWIFFAPSSSPWTRNQRLKIGSIKVARSEFCSCHLSFFSPKASWAS